MTDASFQPEEFDEEIHALAELIKRNPHRLRNAIFMQALTGDENSWQIITGARWLVLNAREKEFLMHVLQAECKEKITANKNIETRVIKQLLARIGGMNFVRQLPLAIDELPEHYAVRQNDSTYYVSFDNLRTSIRYQLDSWMLFEDTDLPIIKKTLALAKDVSVAGDYKSGTRVIDIAGVPIGVTRQTFRTWMAEDEEAMDSTDLLMSCYEYSALAEDILNKFSEDEYIASLKPSEASMIVADEHVLRAVLSTEYISNRVEEFQGERAIYFGKIVEGSYAVVGFESIGLSQIEFARLLWQVLFNAATTEGKLVNRWRIELKDEQLVAVELQPATDISESIRKIKQLIKASLDFTSLFDAYTDPMANVEVLYTLNHDFALAVEKLSVGRSYEEPSMEEIELRARLSLKPRNAKQPEVVAVTEKVANIAKLLIQGNTGELEVGVDLLHKNSELASWIAGEHKLDIKEIFKTLKSDTGLGGLIRDTYFKRQIAENKRVSRIKSNAWMYTLVVGKCTLRILVESLEEGKLVIDPNYAPNAR